MSALTVTSVTVTYRSCRTIAATLGTLERAHGPGGEPFRTDWPCGAALMVRPSVFEAAGGFDPRCFLDFDETDPCRRAVALGFELWAIGRATAIDVGDASTQPGEDGRVAGYVAEHHYRGRFYYLRKHHGLIAAIASELAEWEILGLRAAVNAVFGRGAQRFHLGFRSPIPRMPALPDMAR